MTNIINIVYEYRTVFLLIFLLWELVWKTQALWVAAQQRQKVWFVCILIFNTIGILPIVYLFIIKHQKKNIIQNGIQ